MTTDAIYEQLAAALDRLPNGFPRTESGVELRILEMIFSPEEAALAAQITGKWESLDEIAPRLEQPAESVSRQLFKLARRGMAWFDKRDGGAFFRLAPFIVGIYEAQIELMDHELSHLVEEYLTSGGAAGIMQPQPALHRVVPAQAALKSEQIMPYDDVRAVLLRAKSFSLNDCICRVQQDHMDRRCDFPLATCLSFSERERPMREGDISQAEALALLDWCEETGLVHTVSNVMQGLGYVCNCCGCCCGILRGINDFGIEKSVAYANYYAVIDADLCANCGTCRERCQVNAIIEGDGFSLVVQERCIGCGLCVTGCPNEVARLVRKPEAEMVLPPVDFEAWEEARLQDRRML